MYFLSRHQLFLRCVSVFTALSFLPTSVQAWHFLPAANPGAKTTGTLDLQTLLDVESSLLDAMEPALPLEGALSSAPINPKALSSAPYPQGSKESGTGVPPVISAPQGASAPPKGLAQNLTQVEGVPVLSSSATTSLALAARPEASETPTLYTLSREALESATGGPRATNYNVYDAGLPDASEILAKLVPASQTVVAPPVQIAQAADAPPPLTPGAEAQSALNAAAALRDGGQHSAALRAYLGVMETYPEEPVAVKQADRGIVGYIKAMTAGEIKREQVVEFEVALDSWAPTNAQAGYGALT